MRSASLHHKNSPRLSSEDPRRIQPTNSRSATENQQFHNPILGTLRRDTARTCGTWPPAASVGQWAASVTEWHSRGKGFDSPQLHRNPVADAMGFFVFRGVSLAWGSRVAMLGHQSGLADAGRET